MEDITRVVVEDREWIETLKRGRGGALLVSLFFLLFFIFIFFEEAKSNQRHSINTIHRYICLSVETLKRGGDVRTIGPSCTFPINFPVQQTIRT